MKSFLKLFLGVIGIFAVVVGFAANQLPASQYIYAGSGVKEFSLGYTGISEMGSIDGTSFNPASLGNAKRMAASLSLGGLGSDSFLLMPAFAYPSDFGVFSINGIFLSSADSNGLKSLLGAGISIAKPITEDLFWGAGIKINSANAFTNSDWQLGLDMGIIKISSSDAKGLGFLDPSFGLVLKNIGKTITLGTNDSFPGLGIGGGVSFYAVKLDGYKLKLLGDVFLPFNPINLALNVGMENNLFDFLKIRLGYSLSSDSFGITGIGPLFAGVGISAKVKFDNTNFKLETLQIKSGNEKLENATDIDLSYGIQNQTFNGKSELAHFINLSVAFGYYDDQKPELKAVPDFSAFSPNFDGTQDEIKLSLRVKDNKLVDGWKVKVLDSNKRIVKTYKSMDKLQIKSLTVQKAIGQIFSRKEQVEIPAELSWNGQDENGVRLPDGEYSYILTAWDDNKNTNETEAGRIIIDTVLPKVEAVPQTLIFSPNGDGVKDEMAFSVKSADIGSGDKIEALVRDVQSNVVRAYSYEGKAPEKIAWDGKDNNGKAVPEGVYSFSIAASDAAGNKTESLIGNIHLVIAYQKAELEANLGGISPNSDGVKDSALFKMKVSDAKGLEKWSLRIMDPAGNIVKELTGAQALPGELAWDGKDKNNKLLPDGNYNYELELFFDSGNHPKTDKKTIRVRTTPPIIAVKSDFLAFSPNGKQSTLTFTQSAQGDDSDILETKIMDNSGNIVYYNKSSRKDFSANFVWNGLDKDLKPLPEGNYVYIIEGSDDLGNKSRKEVKDILLKTGLDKTAVQSDVLAISPENKEANLKAVFTPTATSKEGVVSFIFEIDQNNRVVKSVKSDKWIDRIVWDGKDDVGTPLPDGNYNYTLKVKYNYGDEPLSAKKTIQIKRNAPKLEVKADNPIFSPNGDGNKETITFSQKSENDKADSTEALISDASGKPVRIYRCTGAVPKELTWDGTDEKGNSAAEGNYSYQITSTDIAKNKIVRKIDFKLVRSFEKLAMNGDTKSFSVNGDASPHKITFSASLSQTTDLQLSVLDILDASGKIVKQFSKEKGIDRAIFWDGKSENGDFTGDGIYSAEMHCEFASGNIAFAVISNIVFDKTPPEVKWTVSPDLFTPDGDGEDDILFMNLAIADFSGVKDWEAAVYKKMENGESGGVFKKFTGQGPVKQLIQWDGTGDDKEDMVEAVQDYTAQLSVNDTLGNKTSLSKDISVGVLVEKTPEGLRIRVSSIRFATDRADITAEGKKNLDKVIFIIRKILSDRQKYGITDKYRIEVSGHTDDVPGPTADYNQKLSERRAKSVYNYLVENDIEQKILTSLGYGESRPYKMITAGMSREKKNDYRSRNRRVEFFIRK